MDAHAARRMATTAGVATTGIGAVLVAAPARVAALADLDDPRAMRVIGLADLALAPGLVAGRPRWPWLAARAGLNVAMAAFLARAGRSWKAPAVALGLVAITAVDGRAAVTLRTAERG